MESNHENHTGHPHHSAHADNSQEPQHHDAQHEGGRGQQHGDHHGHSQRECGDEHGGQVDGHHHVHGTGHQGHEHHGHGHSQAYPLKFDIKVNGTKVVMHDERPTGMEVKTAALNQGAPIQLTFVLQVEHHDGTSSVVGDTDHVHLHEGLRFTAIAPDDNS